MKKLLLSGNNFRDEGFFWEGRQPEANVFYFFLRLEVTLTVWDTQHRNKEWVFNPALISVYILRRDEAKLTWGHETQYLRIVKQMFYRYTTAPYRC